MSKTTTTKPEVLEALTAVFLEHGFGGATLSLFTEATGLKRPSLYHRFPGGKLDMALAVVEFSQKRFFDEILGPLTGDEEDPRRRIELTARNMERVYDEGNASCVMDAVVLGARGEDRKKIDAIVREMFRRFIAAMTQAAKDLGAEDRHAELFGEEAVLRLEGSLVIARGTGSGAAFKRTLNHLPEILSGRYTTAD